MIEYLEPPLIKEILAQQRMILEMHKELQKILAEPRLVHHVEQKITIEKVK